MPKNIVWTFSLWNWKENSEMFFVCMYVIMLKLFVPFFLEAMKSFSRFFVQHILLLLFKQVLRIYTQFSAH